MLGYAPGVDLEEGLKRFVAWYREAMLPQADLRNA
jgi:nucleoside-diphosphate-sugar epimerase